MNRKVTFGELLIVTIIFFILYFFVLFMNGAFMKQENQVGQGYYCECFVVDNEAYKVFWDRKFCSYSRIVQQHLSKYGLAPKVLSDVTPYENGFYFKSEVAISAEHDMIDYEYIQRKREIDEKLDNLGLVNSDKHPGNYGWIDNKLVLIDTSDVVSKKSVPSNRIREFTLKELSGV